MTRRRTRVVRDVEDLLLLAEPTKLRIFEALHESPASPHELAKRFNRQPTALYHHFGRLERAGLIEVAETRQRRGAVERLYRPALKQVVVDRALAAGGPTSRAVRVVLAAIGAMLQVTADDIKLAAFDRSRGLADPRESEVASTVVRVRPKQARLLVSKVRALIALASRMNGSGTRRVRLTLAAIPVPDGRSRSTVSRS